MSKFRPKLPPMSGFVEEENENGERVYRKISTSDQEGLSEMREAVRQFDELIFEQAYQIALLRLGVE